MDWVEILGGPDVYWSLYKQAMAAAGFSKGPSKLLYVASGLLKSSKEDEWSAKQMELLTNDILTRKVRFAHPLISDFVFRTTLNVFSLL